LRDFGTSLGAEAPRRRIIKESFEKAYHIRVGEVSDGREEIDRECLRAAND
jgi:hypothetical protein